MNVDPVDNKLDDPEERERLRRVFARGLGQPRGFRVAIEARARQERPGMADGLVDAPRPAFVSDSGRFAGGVPAAPWNRCPGNRRAAATGMDAWTRWRPPLRCRCRTVYFTKARGETKSQRRQRSLETASSSPGARSGAGGTHRAGVEARQGRLCIFLPPVTSAEDYVELVAAVEDTAAKLEMPVAIEGYPPADRRAIAPIQGDARSRCHRGERAARRELAPTWWTIPSRFTNRRV